MNEIKDKIRQHFIYIIVEKNTDIRGLYTANLLRWVTNKDFSGKTYILAYKQLEKNK